MARFSQSSSHQSRELAVVLVDFAVTVLPVVELLVPGPAITGAEGVEARAVSPMLSGQGKWYHRSRRVRVRGFHSLNDRVRLHGPARGFVPAYRPGDEYPSCLKSREVLAPEPTMSKSLADRNLLFGILALQMDFVTRDGLIAAMNAWVLDKIKPLGQILQAQGGAGRGRARAGGGTGRQASVETWRRCGAKPGRRRNPERPRPLALTTFWTPIW